MYKITENIYQGGIIKKTDEKIDYVISFLDNQSLSYDCLPEIKDRKFYKMSDGIIKSTNWLVKVLDSIESLIKENKKIYIHCAYGISRSATIVIAYLMKFNHMKFKNALDYLGNINTEIYPSTHYLNWLKAFEEYLDNKKGI